MERSDELLKPDHDRRYFVFCRQQELVAESKPRHHARGRISKQWRVDEVKLEPIHLILREHKTLNHTRGWKVGPKEISCQYILSRWRKDYKRLYVPNLSSSNVGITNPVQCYDHLYRRAMPVVEEGMVSQDHYMVAWQAFKASLNKVHLVAADKID